MIEEAYVSFEVAKLLVRKGFTASNGQHDSYYTLDGETIYLKDKPQEINVAPRYSQAVAMRWLREVHKLYVEVYADRAHNSKDVIFCPQVWDKSFHSIWRAGCFTTYEQACETAIKYCLEKLI